MKQVLFENLSEQEIKDNLEAENCGVEDDFVYIKFYTDSEYLEARERLTEAMIFKSRINKKIKDIIDPLKEELKPHEKNIKCELRDLEQGGKAVRSKVYYFPDYESNLMGFYNEEGVLVSTRPFTRQEKQLHINSFKKVING